MNPTTLDDDQRSNNEEDKEIVADLDSQSCSNYKHIPADVTADILSRLPIKSIGQFILVSKSWRDLITRPCFSSLHAKNTHFSTVYGANKRNYAIYDSHVFEVFENDDVTMTTFKPRGYQLVSTVSIVGSCNGLLCLLDQLEVGFDAISIFNPITNERTGITPSNYDRKCCAFYSFGYSPSTNEYKVFKYITTRVDHCNWRDLGERYYEYGIFTVGVDETWRKLSPHLFPHKMSHIDAVPCNGAFHWLVDGHGNDDKAILAFDIAEENTRRMPIPQIGERQSTLLLVLNDRLCLWWNLKGRGNNLWKMEHYGDSWSEIVLPPKFSLDYDGDLDKSVLLPPNCATKYGGIFFHKNGVLYLYSPQSGKDSTMRYGYCKRRFCEFTPNFSSINEIIGKPSNI